MEGRTMNKKYILPILSGCGTIFSGSTQDISFDSNVKGVEIYVSGIKACKTPCVYPTKNYAKLKEIKKNINIRRFALSNYPSLKMEAAQGSVGEYITALSYLSGLSDEKLIGIINKTNNEIKLAHSLTGIK